MDRARRGRLAALVASVLTALALGIALGGVALAQDGGPVDPCESDPPLPTCESTTTEPPTTTTLPPTTTSTTVMQTTTTRQQTVTTREQVVTTTSTTLSVSTSVDVLIPGDGTEGAESTTTTTQTPTTVSAGGRSDATLLALIVGGLVLLAAAVGILTWRYWQATRPPLVSVGSDHG